MPAEERLSAVAKRRRIDGINYGISSPSVHKDVSVSKPISREQQVVQAAEYTAVNVTLSNASSASEAADSNSFSALANNGAVQLGYVREIERLSDNSVKLRISKGQKCVISGSYSLWLKVGIIELHGARLRPSNSALYIHAPETFEIPAITSITEVAEIEVSSIDTGAPALPLTPVPSWTLPNSNEVFEGTFFVHGSSTSADNYLQKRYKEHDTSFLQDISRKVDEDRLREKARQAPVVLICGREFSGAEAVSSYFLNSLITSHLHKQSGHIKQGVLLIDLDSEVPSFASPGTMSLVLVRDYVFGPAFSHLGVFKQQGEQVPYEILSLQHISPYPGELVCKLRMEWLLKCLRWITASRYSSCPVVVKFYGWFRNIRVHRRSTGFGIFIPDHIVHLGLDSDVTKTEQEGALLPDTQRMTYLPINASKNIPINVQHELLLRSYLHSEGYCGGRLLWSHLPLELDTKRQVWLRYGSSPGSVSSIWGHDLHDLTSDAEDMLCGRVVSVLIQGKPFAEPKKSLLDRNGAEMVQESTYIPSSTDSLMRPGLKVTEGYIDDKATADTEIGMRHSTSSFGDTNSLAAFAAGECLGTGIVAGFDRNQKQLCLITPVARHVFSGCEGRNARITLVVEEIGDEGQYDTAWTQTELDETLVSRPFSKSIHRRRINLQAQAPA